MSDIFGYSRNVEQNQVLSSEYGILNIEGTPLALGQSVSGSYVRRVEPRFATGSTNLYWTSGQPIGQIGCQNVVGTAGWLDAVTAISGNACGAIDAVQMDLSSSGCVAVQGKSSLIFSGGMLRGVSFGFSQGELHIIQGFDMVAGSMAFG